MYFRPAMSMVPEYLLISTIPDHLAQHMLFLTSPSALVSQMFGIRCHPALRYTLPQSITEEKRLRTFSLNKILKFRKVEFLATPITVQIFKDF